MLKPAIALCAALGVCGLAAAAQPAAYPSRPIRLIVPYPPGGGTDLVSRLLAQKLAEPLGQQVVIDNRGGANALIGTDLAAKAAPDGYTMLLTLPASVAVNPSLFPKLPYDPARDFSPVIQLNVIALLLASHPSLPATSVAQLLQLAKAKPGQLTYASSGTGGSSHLAVELLKRIAQIDMTHVPYKGGGPALNDTVGGQVNLYAGPVISSLPLVKGGRLRALGVTTAKRLTALPDIPAISETVPGYESTSWHGVVVPKATPSAIVTRLNAEIASILNQPATRERFAAEGAEVIAGTPAQFGAFIKSETAKYAKLIREARISAE